MINLLESIIDIATSLWMYITIFYIIFSGRLPEVEGSMNRFVRIPYYTTMVVGLLAIVGWLVVGAIGFIF